jgi:hypothetical protein
MILRLSKRIDDGQTARIASRALLSRACSVAAEHGAEFAPTDCVQTPPQHEPATIASSRDPAIIHPEVSGPGVRWEAKALKADAREEVHGAAIVLCCF